MSMLWLVVYPLAIWKACDIGWWLYEPMRYPPSPWTFMRSVGRKR